MKGLARTTVGSKVLRAAYESYFEAAGGHERMFRGLYPDFASAAADAPPGKQVGYDGDATTTRRAHEWHFIFPSDYAVLFWLESPDSLTPSYCSISAAMSGVGTSRFGST